MAEVTDRRTVGITRDEVAALIAAHSGDTAAIRTAVLNTHPEFDTDYIVVEGGSKVPVIDYILDDLESYT